MTNLDSILKSRDITLPTKVPLVKAMVFPLVMYGWESWTIKKAEHQRIDPLEPSQDLWSKDYKCDYKCDYIWTQSCSSKVQVGLPSDPCSNILDTRQREREEELCLRQESGR